MSDKELLEAAKAISENCMNREKCEGCPFEHTGESYLNNFCILRETICYWKEYIEKDDGEISERINSVDFWVDELTRDIDPNHFGFYKRIIPYKDDEKISKFGSWMWNNGYNAGLYNLQTKVNTYCIPQWISVKDRLPEMYVDVLVRTEYGDLFIATIVDTSVESIKAWEDSYGYYLEGNVTHWMPLPEPPKKGDNEDEIEETYMDDIGGIHSPCDCYNPYGYFCGDCSKLSCKACKYRDLQPDEK